MSKRFFSIFVILAVMLLAATGCAKTAQSDEEIRVVATTTMVGDVVRQIADDSVQLNVLFPVGADPHTFEPRPQDIALITDADVIFLNGLELEHTLEPIIEANAKGLVVEVSEGIEPLPFSGEHHDEEHEEEHEHAAGDPHTWMDPNLVMVWVENIKNTLVEQDPDNADLYKKNAGQYLSELSDLDLWIQQEVAKVPVENRKLVTDHKNLGYFIHRYGFIQTGLVVDSLSTGASPSAQELSELVNKIKVENAKAIFVGSAVNPALAEQVASDTGIKVAIIQVESLGEAGSETGTYIQYMKTLVSKIVDALQ